MPSLLGATVSYRATRSPLPQTPYTGSIVRLPPAWPLVPKYLDNRSLSNIFWNTREQAVLMSIGLAGWRANGEELFLSDENSPADENPLKTSYSTRTLVGFGQSGLWVAETVRSPICSLAPVKDMLQFKLKPRASHSSSCE